MKTNKAFTLVEFMVIVAIIGILVALLLPAIQAARNAEKQKNVNHIDSQNYTIIEVGEAPPVGPSWNRAYTIFEWELPLANGDRKKCRFLLYGSDNYESQSLILLPD